MFFCLIIFIEFGCRGQSGHGLPWVTAIYPRLAVGSVERTQLALYVSSFRGVKWTVRQLSILFIPS